jgi:hypothetical protein
MARELTADEIEAVSGGISYTGVTMFEVTDEEEGRVRFNCADEQ